MPGRGQSKENIAQSVTSLLIEQGRSITFMESCTSGLLASMLTDTEGASAIFKGSHVTYSNEMKVRAGVDRGIIEQFGVYSAECAGEMARAAKEYYGADIAVGITGTTGNIDPANLDGVRGEAFYCIIAGDDVRSRSCSPDIGEMSRAEIKQYYADAVYETLYELLKA